MEKSARVLTFRTLVRLLGAAVLAPLLLWTGDARAFSPSGRTWPNQAGNPVIYRMNPIGTKDVTDGSSLTAIRHAFATWQSVSCSHLEFREGAWNDPNVVANDQTNKIFWKQNPGEWTEQPGTIALTYTFYNPQTNEITDSDITINGNNWSFTTDESQVGTGTPAKVDVETVVLHEIGHFFGLNHSTDPNAIMYATNNKPLARAPQLDDIEGVCSLYPNGMPIPSGTPGGPMTSGGPVGAPCQQNADCISAMCVQDNAIGRSYCSQQCTIDMTGSCPAGYVCTNVQQGNLCLAPTSFDELCDQCDQGSQCASGFCTSVPNVNDTKGFCSRPCDPTPGQPAQCPNGYNCLPVEGESGGACSPNTGVCEPLGKGGQGEVCYANGTCKPGYTCVEYFPGSGLNFCYFACASQYHGQSCTMGGGTLCDAVAGLMDTSVCFPIASAGQPCIPEICDSLSFCAYDEMTGVDSALCYRKCPGGQGDCLPEEQCQGFMGLPNLCVPLMGFKYEGEECTGDSECRSKTCRTYGANRLCTSPCAITNPNDCGAGLKCLPQGSSTQGLCWPQSFTDPNAPMSSGRDVTIGSGGAFCACDVTNSCDSGCGCDPECKKGCGCTLGEEHGSEHDARFAIVLCALTLLVRRRPSFRCRGDSAREP
jgi:matrixin